MRTKKDRALDAFAKAFAAYLKAVGWNPLVMTGARIQRQRGAAKGNYEFVVPFIGKKRPAKE